MDVFGRPMQWNRDRRGKVGMMRLGVVDQDGVPSWALSLFAAVLLAFLSCPTWSSKTNGPGLAGAMTMMIHISQILSYVLTHWPWWGQ